MRGTHETDVAARAEELRLDALAKVQANELESALETLDQALAIATDDEFRELVTINKAGVLIQMQQDGPEIQALPRIVLRRPNVRHTFLAAYNLQNRYALSHEFRKAYNYVRIALEMAEAAGNVAWRVGALNATGGICVYESKTAEAITYYREVLGLLEDDEANLFSRSFATHNLGYCLLIEGQPDEGVTLIHTAVEYMEKAGAGGYLAEPYIDLCYGYLDLDRLDDADRYGNMGLEIATENRQIRNAHYLLGEVAFKLGDRDRAEWHFEQLGTHYPDFPNLRNVLMALDLRKVVNFKL